MSDDATPDFDPRFDPAFQRGFDGPVVNTAPVTKPRAQSAPKRPAERSTEEVIQDGPAIEVAGDQMGLVDSDEATGRRVNPFLVALTVLSIVLIVGGLWAAQFARESFLTVNLSTDIDYTTLQMVIIGAPIAIGIGIATALGVLFILAQRWHRGR
jgi:hypothetical protein